MMRSLVAAAVAVTAVAAVATLVTVAGCGSPVPPPAAPAPAPAPAPMTPAPTPAPAGAPAPGIPALTGAPEDLTEPSQAQAGVGAPPTRLLTHDVVVGTGATATPASTVDVRYSGTLYSDGTLFDSSWSRGDAPTSFPLGQVVPGFAQGIEGMQQGGRRVIVIPPALGYGSRPTGPIPADSTLVFVVDLVGVS